MSRELLTTGWRCIIALAGHCSESALHRSAQGVVTIDTEFGRVRATAVNHPDFVRNSHHGNLTSDQGAYVFDRGCENAENTPVHPLFDGTVKPNDTVYIASQNTKRMIPVTLTSLQRSGMADFASRFFINVADSGSGVFVKLANGTFAFAGDVSAKVTPGETPGNRGVVMIGRNWLRQVIARYMPTNLLQRIPANAAATDAMPRASVASSIPVAGAAVTVPPLVTPSTVPTATAAVVSAGPGISVMPNPSQNTNPSRVAQVSPSGSRVLALHMTLN